MELHWLTCFINGYGSFAHAFNMKTKYIIPQVRISKNNRSLTVLNQIQNLLSMAEVYSDGSKKYSSFFFAWIYQVCSV